MTTPRYGSPTHCRQKATERDAHDFHAEYAHCPDCGAETEMHLDHLGFAEVSCPACGWSVDADVTEAER